MPYDCNVRRVGGRTIVIEVEPEQSDCEPFYQRADFAVGLVIGTGDSPLAAAIGDEPLETLARGDVDATPYIASFATRIVQRGSDRERRNPIAEYTIEVTDPKWLRHRRAGDRYASYAYCDAGPWLPDEDVFEPEVRLPVATFTVGQRVAIRSGQGVSPGQLCGRGVIDRAATAARAPRFWDGGLAAYHVALDHGPRVWAFAETLRSAPADTYERVWAAPDAWFVAMCALSPQQRASELRWMGCFSGGDQGVPASQTCAFDVHVAMRATWLYGLLRRLPRARATEVAVQLLADWCADSIGCAARCPDGLAVSDLHPGDRTNGCAYEYTFPIEVTLGALTLHVAFPPSQLPARLAAQLLPALDALETTLWLGYPHQSWTPRVAYLRAAARGVPPRLPSTLVDGVPHFVDEAAAIGLADGALVTPSDYDLYVP